MSLLVCYFLGNSLECYNCSEYQQEHCEQQCDNSDLHCASKREVEYDSKCRFTVIYCWIYNRHLINSDNTCSYQNIFLFNLVHVYLYSAFYSLTCIK